MLAAGCGRWTSPGHAAVSTSASRGEELRARENGPRDGRLPALGRHAAAPHALVPTGRAQHATQRRNTRHDQHQRPVRRLPFLKFPENVEC